MRTARVFYLLLSVLQFIFFLKLVEYVRGEEVQNSQASHFLPEAADQGEYRGLFMAPNMQQKKLRKFNSTKSQTDNLNSSSTTTEKKAGETELNNNNQPITKREQYEHEIARLCPVRFFFWYLCPLDMPFLKEFFPKEMRDIYQESLSKKNNVTVDTLINSTLSF